MRDGRAKGRVLAVASEGGHWVELMLLAPALEPFDPLYVTTDCELGKRDGVVVAQVLPDSNRTEFVRSLFCAHAAWRLIRRERPAIVVTTGALPGLFCLVFGRLSGAKTIWIDSIANSDEPSLSGRLAKLFANLWLTQWEHVAAQCRVEFKGALL